MKDYLYVDSIQDRGEIHVWVRDDTGLYLESYPASEFAYCFIPDNTGSSAKYKDLWGRPMKKVSFNNRRDLKEFATSEKYVCESDVQFKYKALIDKYHTASETANFHFCLFDIEVDFDLSEGKGYPLPSNPHGEINFIQCWDNKHKRYTIFCLEEFAEKIKLKDKDHPVEIVKCWDERMILESFAKYLSDIDVITGWFSGLFDLPYIMERALILFSEERALTMFCRDGFKAYTREFFDSNGTEQVAWELVGRKHVDLVEIYKKFIPGQRQSFSLDAICEEDLNERKVQYEDEGDLGILYRENPQKFAEYGLRDVQLLYMLNSKHNLMETAMALAVQSSVTINDVTGSVKPIEMNLIKFCRKKGNIVLPNKQHSDSSNFPGAIVYDTISGKHNWVISADLAGLYPSVMVMLGLSPETVVAQLDGEYDDYVAVMSGRDKEVLLHEKEGSKVLKSYMINAKELFDIIRENGFTISGNGTIFDGSLGIVAEYIQDGVNRRNEAKAKAKELYKTNPALSQQYDLLQKVLKIRNNSAYGCITNEHFRLFDVNLGASITITGQLISKFQAVDTDREIDRLNEVLNAG